MTNPKMKDGLALGTTLLVIHSVASFLVFLYCHINTEGQSVFAYFLFFVVDAPTVPLAFEIEGKIGLLTSLTDSWTDLWYYGHQGVNLRAFILTALFGGLHWFMIGNLTSYAIGWYQQRLKCQQVWYLFEPALLFHQCEFADAARNGLFSLFHLLHEVVLPT